MLLLFGIGCVGLFLGSLPFGFWLTRLAGRGDIRAAGSGGTGATNVLRIGGKGPGALTLLLDAGKGALAAGFGMMVWGSTGGWLGALAAVVGHIFPFWLKFRGGKGVATALGASAMLEPVLTAGGVCVWLLCALGSRFSSLSSMLTMGTMAAAGVVMLEPIQATALALIAVLVMSRHRANVVRLWQHREPRIGESVDFEHNDEQGGQ